MARCDAFNHLCTSSKKEYRLWGQVDQIQMKISDRVGSKQLKALYPEFTDTQIALFTPYYKAIERPLAQDLLMAWNSLLFCQTLQYLKKNLPSSNPFNESISEFEDDE